MIREYKVVLLPRLQVHFGARALRAFAVAIDNWVAASRVARRCARRSGTDPLRLFGAVVSGHSITLASADSERSG